MLVSLLVLSAAGFIQAQELPTYTCYKTAVAPAIDGRGDDQVWRQAEVVGMVDVEDLHSGESPSRPTEVCMLWDERKLYILFIASDPDVWSVLVNRDDPLWNGEVVEVYSDPDGDGANYVEIEVNPLNAVVDLLLSKPGRQGGQAYFDWSPQYETAVHVESTVNDPSDQDQYWSVEMALPWSMFDSDILNVAGGQSLPPQSGDAWRFNFYRYERLRTDTTETGIEYSAWSPVGEINFHRPDRFGTVVFAPTPTAVMELSWGLIKSWAR
jgi:hypothetical protein